MQEVVDPGPTRWGILSAGKISHDFVTALNLLPRQEHLVTAVATRKLEDAQHFIQKFGLDSAAAYGGYEYLAKDENIDIVYIGTIHPYHHENAIMLMKAGKNVLCEKPLGMNSREVKEMVAVAKQNNVFFAEGLWSRHFPVYKQIKEEINKGTIGKVQMVSANFGVKSEDVLKGVGSQGQNKLGGGALMYLGPYPVQFASFVFTEKPQKITATGVVTEYGCDASDCILLQYSGERFAVLNVSRIVDMDQIAVIQGEKGKIEIPYMWCPDEYRVNGVTHKFPLPECSEDMVYPHSEGFVYQAQAVRQTLLEGKKELAEISFEDSLMIAEIMDEVRKQMGVVFEVDKV